MYCGKIKHKRMLFYHQNVSESIKTHQNESEALRTCQMKSMAYGIEIIFKFMCVTVAEWSKASCWLSRGPWFDPLSRFACNLVNFGPILKILFSTESLGHFCDL